MLVILQQVLYKRWKHVDMKDSTICNTTYSPIFQVFEAMHLWFSFLWGIKLLSSNVCLQLRHPLVVSKRVATNTQ